MIKKKEANKVKFRKSAVALGVALMFTANMSIAQEPAPHAFDAAADFDNTEFVYYEDGVYMPKVGGDHQGQYLIASDGATSGTPKIDLTTYTNPDGTADNSLNIQNGVGFVVVGEKTTPGENDGDYQVALKVEDLTVQTGGTFESSGGEVAWATGTEVAGKLDVSGTVKGYGGGGIGSIGIGVTTGIVQNAGEITGTGGDAQYAQGILVGAGIEQKGGAIIALAGEHNDAHGIYIKTGDLEQSGVATIVATGGEENPEGANWSSRGISIEAGDLLQTGNGVITAQGGHIAGADGIHLTKGTVTQSGGGEIWALGGAGGAGISITPGGDDPEGKGKLEQTGSGLIVAQGGSVLAAEGIFVRAGLVQNTETVGSLVFDEETGDVISGSGAIYAIGGSVDSVYGIQIETGGLTQSAGNEGLIVAEGGGGADAVGILVDAGGIAQNGGTIWAFGSDEAAASGIHVQAGGINQGAGGVIVAYAGEAAGASGISIQDTGLSVAGKVHAFGGGVGADDDAASGITIVAGGMTQTAGEVVAEGGDHASSAGIRIENAGGLTQSGGVIKAEGVVGRGIDIIGSGLLAQSGEGKIEAEGGSAAGAAGIHITSGNLTQTDSASIVAKGGTDATAYGINVMGGSITQTGTEASITAIGSDDGAMGIFASAGLTATGTIEATGGKGSGFGIGLNSGALTQTTGEITATGGAGVAHGIQLTSGALVQNGGIINAYGGTGNAAGINVEDDGFTQAVGAVFNAYGSADTSALNVSGSAVIRGTLNVEAPVDATAVHIGANLTVDATGILGVHALNQTDAPIAVAGTATFANNSTLNIIDYAYDPDGDNVSTILSATVDLLDSGLKYTVGGVASANSLIQFEIDVDDGVLSVAYDGLNPDVWDGETPGAINRVPTAPGQVLPVYEGLVGQDDTRLEVYGGGTLQLRGVADYGGGTQIEANTTISIDDANRIGYAIDAENNIHNTGTLELTASGDYDHDWVLGTAAGHNAHIAVDGEDTVATVGVLSGPGNLVKDGDGTLELTKVNDYADTTINAGILRIGSDDNIGSGLNTIGTNGTLELTGTTYELDWTLGGASSAILVDSGVAAEMEGDLIGAGGTLNKEGGGTLILSGSNNYAGGTNINAGTLSIGALENIGAGVISIGNATLQLTNEGEIVFPSTMGLVVQEDSEATVEVKNASATAVFEGQLSGEGDLVKAGAGTMVLDNATNPFTGDLIQINAGTLEIAGELSGGDYEGTIWIAPGATLDLSWSGDQTFSGETIKGFGDVDISDGTKRLRGTGDHEINKATVYSGATLTVDSAEGGSAEIRDLVMYGDSSVIATSAGSMVVGEMNIHHARKAPLTGNEQSSLTITGAVLTPEKSMTFHVDETSIGNTAAVLLVTGTGTLDIMDTRIVLAGLDHRSVEVEGEVINLIRANQDHNVLADGHTAYYSLETALVRGVTELAWDGNNYAATVKKSVASDEAKTLAEGYVTGVALVNQGADVVAGLAMANAVEATSTGVNAFAAIQGGRNNYDVGSKSRLDSVSLLVGAANGWAVSDSKRMTVGGFVEYGTGSYDTEHSFADGDGNSYYYGLGGLARLDIGVAGGDRAYVEGSVRLGQVKNKNDALFNGGTVSYDASSMYYGLHVGGGYILNISEKSAIDLYGKYLWTRVASETTDVRNDPADNVHFNGVNSHRTRLGGRYIYQATSAASVYGGLAWEHEFDAKAKSTVNYLDTAHTVGEPDLKGSSAMLEAGVRFTPSDSTPLYIDLGLTGYLGKRDGIMGNLRVNYRF